MHQNMPDRPGVHEDAPPDPKLAAWWRSLTTRAKKALARRRDRTEAKKLARAAPVALTSGYQCPKCWGWHPTPTERKACRVGHPVPWRFDCEECGLGVRVDEDGCCVTCGRDCNPGAPKDEA